MFLADVLQHQTGVLYSEIKCDICVLALL